MHYGDGQWAQGTRHRAHTHTLYVPRKQIYFSHSFVHFCTGFGVVAALFAEQNATPDYAFFACNKLAQQYDSARLLFFIGGFCRSMMLSACELWQHGIGGWFLSCYFCGCGFRVKRAQIAHRKMNAYPFRHAWNRADSRSLSSHAQPNEKG